MEGSATLIAHSGKAGVAAFRQSGLVYKIAAGDGKRGVTFFGYNLTVKQAVADGDGSVRTLERHTLFKGPALDRGLSAGGGVYLDSFLKGAAGDGAAVVVQNPLEGTVGDGAAEVVRLPLEGAVGDGTGVVHIPLEGAAGDDAVIVGFTADGAAVKFGIFTNIEFCLQCAFSLGLRGGLQGKNAIVQPTTGVSAVVPIGTVAAACGLAIGVQLDGNAIGGAVFCVQITAAAGDGFLLGAAGGVGLLYKGCSLFGRGLGGCIEHRGCCQCRHRQQGQQHTAGQQDAYNAFDFHKVSLLSCGFYTGCRYHKYTIN